ncbi:MAG TPA: nucleotide exchange factor GrpE [Polyangia bacterium]
MSDPKEQPASDPSDPAAAAASGPGGTASGDGATGPVSLEQRVANLEAERNEARDRMLRVAAEFENYKKRTRREQSEGEAKVKEGVLRDLIEVADNLERALAFDEKADFKSLQKGLELVLRLFQGKLERYDIKAIEAKGQPFDPRIHDAVSQLPTADVPAGSVVSEIQKGYRMGDRLLRPALVVVAAPPPAAPAPGPDGGGAAP